MAKDCVAAQREGPAGFLRWLEYFCPRLLVGNRYEEVTPRKLLPWQGRAVPRILAPGIKTAVTSTPRRCGKTALTCLVLLWRFTTRPNQVIGLVSASEQQSQSVTFRQITRIIKNTPKLAQLIGLENIGVDKIVLPALDNVILACAASEATLFGVGFSVVAATELGAFGSSAEKAFQAAAGGTGDRPDGLILCDSTVGPKSSLLYSMYTAYQRGEDPALEFVYEQWDGEGPYLNPNVTPAWLANRKATSHPSEYNRLFLNRWQDGGSPLLTEGLIESCLIDAVPSRDELAERSSGGLRSSIGADLAIGYNPSNDLSFMVTIVESVAPVEEIPREKSEFWWPGSTVPAEYRVLEDQSIFYVARCVEVPRDVDRKAELEASKRAWGYPDFVELEQFQAASLHQHALSQGLHAGLVSPSRKNQFNAFTALYEVAAAGQLRIPREHAALIAALKCVEVDSTTVPPTFGSPDKRRQKDDAAFALAWGLYPLKANRVGIWRVI